MRRTAPDQAAPDQAARSGPARGRTLRLALTPAADLLAVVLATAITGAGLARGTSYGVAALVALAAAGLYRERISSAVSDQAGRLALAVAIPAAVLLPWTPAAQVLRLALVAAVLAVGLRAVARAGLRAAWRRGRLARRTLIIGAGAAGQQLTTVLRQHPELGLQPCGVVDGSGPAAPEAGLLGGLAEAGSLAARLGISQVLVCGPAGPEDSVLAAVRACRARGARVSLQPRLPELGAAVPRRCLDEIFGLTFIPVRPDPGADAGRRAAKRALDLAAGSAVLVLTAPLMLALAAAVRFDLRLPPLFRQVRVVGRGREATIAKLRTLRPAGDPDTSWVIPDGQSSRLGRLLRATHADELPQLVSVVRGGCHWSGRGPSGRISPGSWRGTSTATPTASESAPALPAGRKYTD